MGRYLDVMAVLPALVAVIVGLAAGILRGGKPANIATWRLYWWPLLVIGLVGQLAVQFVSLPGGDTTDLVLGVGAEVLLVVFALLNLHINGMSILAVGLLLNIVPTVLNSGTPVNRDAMISAGVVDETDLDTIVLTGNRHVAGDSDTLAVLGDVIPLPFARQVISIGDIVVLVGLGFIVSSLMRPRRPGRGISYDDAIRELTGSGGDAGGGDGEDELTPSAGGGRPVITGADRARAGGGETAGQRRRDGEEEGNGKSNGGNGGGNGRGKPDTDEFEIDMDKLSLFAPGRGDGVVIDLPDRPVPGGTR